MQLSPLRSGSAMTPSRLGRIGFGLASPETFAGKFLDRLSVKQADGRIFHGYLMVSPGVVL